MAHLEACSFEIIINERPSEKEARLATWKNEQIRMKRALETQLHQTSDEISQLEAAMAKYAEPVAEEWAVETKGDFGGEEEEAALALKEGSDIDRGNEEKEGPFQEGSDGGDTDGELRA